MTRQEPAEPREVPPVVEPVSFTVEPPRPDYDLAKFLRMRRLMREMRSSKPRYLTFLNFDEHQEAPACAIVVLIS